MLIYDAKQILFIQLIRGVKMAKEKPKSKFYETFYSIKNRLRSGEISKELDDLIDFYLRNEKDNYGYQIVLAKELIIRRHRIDFALDLLKSIVNNEELLDSLLDPHDVLTKRYSAETAKEILNHAKFELARGLSTLKIYQESYDYYIELLNSSFRDLALVGIGRILCDLGYKNESLKAYDKLTEKIRKDKASLEIGRLQLASRKYLAASNNFYNYMKHFDKHNDGLRQMLYLHIKNNDKFHAYEDLMKYSIEEIQSDPELLNIAYYLKKHVAYFNLDIEFPDNYLIKQMTQYDIKYVQSMYGERLYNYDDNTLIVGADITNLFTYAKAAVDYTETVKVAFIDYYVFDYKCDIATLYGLPTSRIMVGVLPNTKDIVSIKVIPKLDDPEKFLRKRNK